MRKRCLSLPLLSALQAGGASTAKATFAWKLNLKGTQDPQLMATVAKVPGGECISDLQQEIRSLWKMSKLADLDPIYIGLYKAPIAHTSNNIDNPLQGFYLQLDQNEHQSLKPITKIKDAFLEHRTAEFIVVDKPLGELLLKAQPSLWLDLATCHLPT